MSTARETGQGLAWEVSKIRDCLARVTSSECQGQEKEEALAKVLVLHDVLRKYVPESYLAPLGLPQDRAYVDLSGRIENNAGLAAAVLNRLADDLIREATGRSDHKGKRENLETALKLLRKSEMSGALPETDVLMARAYFLRSLIIRPKGFSVPEKKRDLLERGLFFAKRAVERTDGSVEAHRIVALIGLELEKLGAHETETVEEYLTTALIQGVTEDVETTEGILIAARYTELTHDTSYASYVINSSLRDVWLEKARVAVVDENEAGAREFFSTHLVSLKNKPFLDPVWRDTVDFLVRLKRDGKTVWDEFALETLKACQVQERRTGNQHLRWYWSGLRTLYDLAFLAENDNRKKAEIADALKGRIPLRWKAMEAMGEDVSVYEAALLGRYVPSYGGLVGPGGARGTAALPGNLAIPRGWTVVHFYISKTEEKGYAIIGNEDRWNLESFEYKELFQSYRMWRTNYSSQKGGNSSSQEFVRLCRKIGEEMRFLFSLHEGPVLFVPHDFLHRLPLHAAIDGKDNDTVFLEKHRCAYLPAWSFSIPRQGPIAKHGGDGRNGRALVVNFDDDYSDLTLNKDQKWNIVYVDAKMSDLSDCCRNGETGLLAVLTHGNSDPSNPFRTHLVLQDGKVTAGDLLAMTMELKDAVVFLGACETDMLPSLTDTIDEHFSVASAFLVKGASCVVGTQYVAAVEDIAELLKDHLSDIRSVDEAPEACYRWQGDQMAGWRNEKGVNSGHFYDAAVFRIYLAVFDSGEEPLENERRNGRV